MTKQIKKLSNFFSYNMKNTFVNIVQVSSALLMALLILTFNTVSSQNKDIARPAPKGIIVFNGNEIPNGKNISSYNIFRKDVSSNWKTIAEVKSPETAEAFIKSVYRYQSYFPDISLPEKHVLESAWHKLDLFKVYDSIPRYADNICVRLAVGMMFYDTSATEKLEYHYKIEHIKPGGSVTEVKETRKPVAFPFFPAFDKPVFAESELSGNIFYVRWESLGKNPGKQFRVYRYDNAKTLSWVNAETYHYPAGDSTRLIIIADTGIIKGNTYQYFLVPLDWFGNPGQSSDISILTPSGFNEINLSSFYASKSDDMLCIKLHWNISAFDNVRNIDVFKSNDLKGEYKLLASLSPSDTMFHDCNIEEDVACYYYITITSSDGNNTKSSSKVFAHGTNPMKPQAPDIIRAESIENGVRLYINIYDLKLNGIIIYRNDGINEELSPVVNLSLIDSSLLVWEDKDPALKGRMHYRYSVRAESGSGVMSDFSETVFCKPVKNVEMLEPARLSAYYENSAIYLFWDNMNEVDILTGGYELVRTQKGEGESSFTNPVLLSPEDEMLENNFFIDNNIEGGLTYRYEVKSVDVSGQFMSRPSWVIVNAPLILPVPPGSITAVKTDEGIAIEWSMVADENLTNYKLYRYERKKQPELITLTDSDVSAFTDKSGEKGKLYFYYVTCVDGKNRESTASPEVSIYR